MKNDKLDGKTQEIAVVHSTPATQELISNQTAKLIEKSLPRTRYATAGMPYRSLARGSRGDRFPTDSSLKQTGQSTAEAALKI